MRLSTMVSESTTHLIISAVDPREVESAASKKANSLQFSDAVMVKKEREQTQSSEVPSSSLLVKLTLGQIGISIMDSRPRELMFITVRNIEFMWERQDETDDLGLLIGHVQVDNMLHNTPFPVVLYSITNQNANFFVLARVLIDRVPWPSSHVQKHFHDVSVSVTPMEVRIDEVFFSALMVFATEVVNDVFHGAKESENWVLARHGSIPKSEMDLLGDLALDPRRLLSDVWRVDYLRISPAKIILSLTTVKDAGDRDPEGGKLKALLKQQQILLGFNANHITKVVSAVDRARIILPQVGPAPVEQRAADLFIVLGLHYAVQSSAAWAAEVLAHSDISSAITAISHIGLGIGSFFHEPIKGAREGGTRGLIGGVGTGTRKFASNTFNGTFKTLSVLSQHIGNTMAYMSADNDYQKWRQQVLLPGSQPQHAGEGLKLGAWIFGKSVLEGVTDVVTKPVEYGREQGAWGVFKGLAVGTVGLLTKPITGTVDAVAAISYSISSTTDYFKLGAIPDRERAPRWLAKGSIVKPFDSETSMGQELMWLATNYRAGGREHYMVHYKVIQPVDEVDSQLRLIVTDRRALLVKYPKDHRKCALVAEFITGSDWTIVNTQKSVQFVKLLFYDTKLVQTQLEFSCASAEAALLSLKHLLASHDAPPLLPSLSQFQVKRGFVTSMLPSSKTVVRYYAVLSAGAFVLYLQFGDDLNAWSKPELSLSTATRIAPDLADDTAFWVIADKRYRFVAPSHREMLEWLHVFEACGATLLARPSAASCRRLVTLHSDSGNLTLRLVPLVKGAPVNASRQLHAVATAPSEQQMIELTSLGPKVVMMSMEGRSVYAKRNGNLAATTASTEDEFNCEMQFKLIKVRPGKVALRSYHGAYLRVDANTGTVAAVSTVISRTELFAISYPPSTVCLRTADGLLLACNTDGLVTLVSAAFPIPTVDIKASDAPWQWQLNKIASSLPSCTLSRSGLRFLAFDHEKKSLRVRSECSEADRTFILERFGDGGYNVRTLDGHYLVPTVEHGIALDRCAPDSSTFSILSF